MKTLTLKTDDRFFEKVTDLAKRLHLSKSELIRRAIADYEEHIRRKELAERMKEASYRVREVNRRINESFETTLADGLNND
jgi:predicted transcriptional regulator